jgi:hypothetical protein
MNKEVSFMKNLTKISKLNEKLILDEDIQEVSLEEGKYGFVKEYKGYRIMNTPDYYVITDKNGKTITQTKWGLPVAEAIIDDIIEQNSNNIADESLKEDIKEDDYMENIPEKGTYIAYGHAGIESIKDAKEKDYYIEVTKDKSAGDVRYEIWIDPSRRYDGSPRNINEAVEDDDLLELEEPIDEEPTEPVTQEVADNAYLMQINDLIASEYAKIDNVKSIIATFDSEDAIQNNSEVISILNAFIDETTISIGMLTKASELIDSDASSLMQQGIDKAEEVINDVDEEDKKEETKE